MVDVDERGCLYTVHVCVVIGALQSELSEDFDKLQSIVEMKDAESTQLSTSMDTLEKERTNLLDGKVFLRCLIILALVGLEK